jgi:alpha-ketoglutarate-dependent taurine dioxygenase
VTELAEVGSLSEVEAALYPAGAVLVRGPSVGTPAELARAREALGRATAARPELYADSTDFGDGVYSAPEWGADREMCLHHEQAYRTVVPRILLMACAATPSEGGEILLGDTRQVLSVLPAELVAQFRAAGWLLERNFRPYFGLPWSVAFGVSDPAQLTAYGDDAAMTVNWRPDGSLHTSQRRAAVVRHPVTGDECWCNDVGFFSQWSVDEVERKILLSSFGPDGIPFNTAAGDGTPLSSAQWQSIIDAYDAVTLRVRLREGDLLVIDNILTAHGRAPYKGSRQILMALAEPTASP